MKAKMKPLICILGPLKQYVCCTQTYSVVAGKTVFWKNSNEWRKFLSLGFGLTSVFCIMHMSMHIHSNADIISATIVCPWKTSDGNCVSSATRTFWVSHFWGKDYCWYQSEWEGCKEEVGGVRVFWRYFAKQETDWTIVAETSQKLLHRRSFQWKFHLEYGQYNTF